MQPLEILIVAHKTASSGQLLGAVKERAERESCRFTLLVPAAPHGLHRIVDPEDHGRSEARRAIEDALPALQAAAGGSVRAIVGSHDPLAAVEDAINLGRFEAVIISTLLARASRWLRLDLPHKVVGLELPVTHVAAEAREVVTAAA
jgi:hypothetical protein